ncbi:MAG: putative endonuclease/exonuclease/phosphatase-family protein [Patescibacteria group bacterium]|nr:putative endonuclease/exonuclease/phosphatase-family protein [Patescibacteria group bacterium]
MKLMTYNILNGGGDRLGLIAKIINESSPDFLTINEANGFDENHNKKLKDLSHATNMPYYHLALSGEYDYHVAVLSKLPLKHIDELHPMMRAGISVVLDSDIGEISIIGAHLTPYSESLRLPEINLLITNQRGHANRILMGDMNSLSKNDNYSHSIVQYFNEPQLKQFTKNENLQFEIIEAIEASDYVDAAVELGRQSENTLPASSNKDIAHANTRLDYIFVSPSLKSKLAGYSVIKNELTEQASDHYPVLVELRLRSMQ